MASLSCDKDLQRGGFLSCIVALLAVLGIFSRVSIALCRLSLDLFKIEVTRRVTERLFVKAEKALLTCRQGHRHSAEERDGTGHQQLHPRRHTPEGPTCLLIPPLRPAEIPSGPPELATGLHATTWTVSASGLIGHCSKMTLFTFTFASQCTASGQHDVQS